MFLSQHGILFCKYLISVVVPEAPKAIREKIAEKEFINAMCLKQLRYEKEGFVLIFSLFLNSHSHFLISLLGCPCYVDLEEYDDAQWWSLPTEDI